MDAAKSKDGTKNSVNFGSNLYHRPLSNSLTLGEWISLPKVTSEPVRSSGIRSKPIMKRTDFERDFNQQYPVPIDLLTAFSGEPKSAQVANACSQT